MFNIHIKGKFENEAQLLQGKELSQKAVQFKEGRTLLEAFRLGFVLSLPIMLPMVILSVIRCSELDKHLEFDGSLIVAIVITVLLRQVLIYLHEFIHAIFYPKEAEKTVWKDLKQGAYFVYCDAEVTKIRFIVLCLAPSIILGIIPFFIWYIVAPILEAEWIICIMVLTWMMTFMSMGDFANVYNAIRQVPKNAKVFNHGMHSYWIE
ncbi:DUF3267 domain-containing protein [Roseburia sp. 499]|uniref:DUF3267 domain-containing protein n=1 Tax=Roseburia sp. 499 TaxID=1261634 RepID=UPI00095213BC|nr:DUF3267 domain-containing protein [Roseburia sp. 499]WVK68895.1 DUF3267 domain-containing protein [Roseburia sp. 499]